MGTFVLATTSTSKSSGGSFEFILFAVAIFALVYVFMIRPQQRRRQQAAQKTNTDSRWGSAFVLMFRPLIPPWLCTEGRWRGRSGGGLFAAAFHGRPGLCGH